MELAVRIFETVGRTVTVDEKHMNAVTGLSGSGPAYIYIIIEALAEAGVKVGLPRDVATQLAAQTAFGAAKMVLETGYHPAMLKDAVTTPAGCTIDGILELEEAACASPSSKPSCGLPSGQSSWRPDKHHCAIPDSQTSDLGSSSMNSFLGGVMNVEERLEEERTAVAQLLYRVMCHSTYDRRGTIQRTLWTFFRKSQLGHDYA